MLTLGEGPARRDEQLEPSLPLPGPFNDSVHQEKAGRPVPMPAEWEFHMGRRP